MNGSDADDGVSFIRDFMGLYEDAQKAKESAYKDGYLAALEQVLELWEEHQ